MATLFRSLVLAARQRLPQTLSVAAHAQWPSVAAAAASPIHPIPVSAFALGGSSLSMSTYSGPRVPASPQPRSGGRPVAASRPAAGARAPTVGQSGYEADDEAGVRNSHAKRSRTAYGSFDPEGKQRRNGPHLVAHVLKSVAAKKAFEANPKFDPSRILERTGVIPSAGQNRKVLRRYEEATGIELPIEAKRAYDQRYKDALAERSAGTADEKAYATARAMELAAHATYALGRKASAAELAGKGERSGTVAPTLAKFREIRSGQQDPVSGAGVDDAGLADHSPKYVAKMQRDLGRISLGHDADLSPLDTSSDEEYPEPASEGNKRTRRRGRPRAAKAGKASKPAEGAP